MAALRFNLHGYVFETGLGDIRRAYDATIAALERQRMDLDGKLLEFRRALAAGETEAYEYDEHGDELYSREYMHEMLIVDAASTISIARKAYVVILHHYWEKRCDEWMHSERNYDRRRAYAFLSNHGLQVDCSGLEILRKTSNTIKHNKSELFEARPDLFESPQSGSATKIDYDDLLRLPQCEIDKMFEAVKTSGIQIGSEFAPSLMPQQGPRRA